jgi:ubiquitin-conjugating enzyme (huntingtin interacting protein 2)
VANQYKDKREEFEKTARQWTAEHANPNKMRQDKMKKLTDMGFTEDQAIEALDKVGWDENEAIQLLIG